MNSTRVFLALGISLSIAMLAACAAPQSEPSEPVTNALRSPTSTASLAAPNPNATTSSTSVPSGSNSASTKSIGSKPDTRFQFECSDLLSEQDASALLGSPVRSVDNIATALSSFWTIPREATIAQAGGLVCEWSNGMPQNSIGGSTAGYVGYQVLALPDAAGEWQAAQTKGLGGEYVGCSRDICNSTVLAGSTWFQTIATNIVDDGRTAADRRASFQEIQNAMSAVSTTAATPAVKQVSLAAVLPESCSGYASNAQMSAAAGATISTFSGGDGGGGGWSIEAEGAEISGQTHCNWATDTGKYLIALQALPGAAWVPNDYEDVDAPQGESVLIAVAGLGAKDTAYLRCTGAGKRAPDNACVLDLAISGNWVQLQIYPSQGGWSKNSVAPETALKAIAVDVVAALR